MKLEKQYTTEEIAKILNLSPYTIRKYVRNGVIKAERIGGKREIIRISETELKRYLETL